MPHWVEALDPHWAWLSLGVLLVALEILVPGFFMIWLGLAALVTGIIAWVFAPSVPIQLGIFAILSLLALFGARAWLNRNPVESSDPLLNQRGHRLIGEVVMLTQAIENGRGRAKVADGEWPVRGPDAAQHSKVRIIGVDGGTLLVELA